MTEKVFGSEKKGSIQDIPLPQDNHKKQQHATKETEADGGHGGTHHVNGWGAAKRKNKRLQSKLLVALLGVLVLLGVYSWLFHSAYVEITPKTQQVTVANEEFTSRLNGDELAFVRIDPITKTISSHVEGTEEENRQTKASGLLTVYNTDSGVKNYIKNTRFETEDGRIYRAFQRFVIPKGTPENPGSVEVLVTAENPGEKYNAQISENLRFTLPALKENGDPDFNNVYAQLKEDLDGGFSGVIKVPSEDEIASEKTTLESQIKQELTQEFNTKYADLYITHGDLLAISEVVFAEKPNAEKGGIDVEARAELNAAVFNKETFDSYMAQRYIDNIVPSDVVVITNFDELSFVPTSESFDPTESEEFTFTLAGEIRFEWQLVEEEIKNVLAGNLKSHVNSGLVSGLQNTSSVEASISPFWRRSIPQDTDSIEVVIK